MTDKDGVEEAAVAVVAASDGNNQVADWDYDPEQLADTVYDLIREIKDPEKPESLEDLEVVYEDGVSVSVLDSSATFLVRIEFKPTISHCSLATLIGLCLRVKLERNLPRKHKLDIYVKEGSHDSAKEVTKQINDKERVAAALENTNLLELVEQCIADPE